MALDCLILVDENFDVVALDSGAEAILIDLHRGNGNTGRSAHLPPEILSLLKTRADQSLDEKNLPLKIGGLEYSCRILWIRPTTESPCQPMMALYLRRELSIADAVVQAAAEYHLTDREQEALIGVTMGLTSKEVAERMEISPNTVKAFLRLIMIKMGVPTRAAIVGRLLDQSSGTRKVPTNGK